MRKKMNGSRLAITTAATVTLLYAPLRLAFGAGSRFRNLQNSGRAQSSSKRRPGHARCVVCHEASNSAFRLQPLTPGSTKWTEEQSRRNFESVSHLVNARQSEGEQASDSSSVAGCGRGYISRRRPAIRLSKRSGLDRHRRVGQQRKIVNQGTTTGSDGPARCSRSPHSRRHPVCLRSGSHRPPARRPWE